MISNGRSVFSSYSITAAMRSAGFLTVLLAAGCTQPSRKRVSREQRPPNFVIIFTDDQGYGDVGTYGAKGFVTPNLDRMAKEGLRFTDFYVPATVCTPSRAALLTGCYPKRVGLSKHVLFPQSKTGLAPSELTIAELLKTRGYATACIGKWHLGHHKKLLPTRQGCDRYFALPYSNDMTTTRIKRKGYPKLPLMSQEEVLEYEPDQTQLTKRYTEEAVRFLRGHRDEPFFLYLPHSMPHIPIFASERFLGRTKRGLYGDVIEEIDWSVGQIRKTLREIGQEKNTLLIFTSDNGPWLSQRKNGGSAGPLRAGKGTTWEGGPRVPALMCWPGQIPAGTICRELVTTMELLPTIAALAGAALPLDRRIDGLDIRALLEDPERAKSPRKELYYYGVTGELEAIRVGPWKLHTKKTRGWRRKKDGPFRPFLVNLESDIGERKNLAAEHPKLVQDLIEKMRRFDAELRRSSRPVGRIER